MATVSTHSRLKAAGTDRKSTPEILMVSTHSRLKAAGCALSACSGQSEVSTHSRLKAAGCSYIKLLVRYQSFNTQPPEGGWDRKDVQQI